MPEHPNAALVRGALRAFQRGDIQVALDTLADDVEWHEIGGADAGIGKEALAALFGGPLVAGSELTSEIHDVVANDDHVIALVEAMVRRGGQSLAYRTVEIFHVSDGKITARWAFSDDTAAIKEFFADT